VNDYSLDIAEGRLERGGKARGESFPVSRRGNGRGEKGHVQHPVQNNTREAGVNKGENG